MKLYLVVKPEGYVVSGKQTYGLCPTYTNKKKAEKAAQGKYLIVTLEVEGGGRWVRI